MYTLQATLLCRYSKMYDLKSVHVRIHMYMSCPRVHVAHVHVHAAVTNFPCTTHEHVSLHTHVNTCMGVTVCVHSTCIRGIAIQFSILSGIFCPWLISLTPVPILKYKYTAKY